jgi:outer membrane protein
VSDDDIPAVDGCEGISSMRLAQAFSIGVIVIAVFVSQAAGQGPATLGLTQAIEAALEDHPLLRSSRLGIEQAGNRAAEARAERIPKIRVSETLTHGNNPVFAFGSLLEQGRFGPENFELSRLNNPPSLTNLRTVLSASFPIFDGQKTSMRIAQAGTGRDQALLHNRNAEQQVRFEVLAKYLDVLLAETALGVTEEAVRMAESDVKRARDRRDAGLAVESDLLSAQVQLAEFRQQRIEAEGLVATGFAALNISMGAPSGTQYTLTFRLPQKRFDVAPPDELVNRALLHRSDYLQSEYGVEIADRRAAERRSEYFPEVNVFASVGSSLRNLTTGSADYTIGAGASFSVFDRTRSPRVAQALVDKRLAEVERDRLSDQIRIEVLRAYHRHRATEQQVEVAEAALSQAAEGLRIIQNRYEAGLITISEMLRAETAVVRARMNVAAARHGQYLGYASVLLSVGELNDVRAFEP